MTELTVITGAAGALGRAVLEQFLATGAAVVAMNRPGRGLDELAELDGVHPVAVDLTDPDGVRAAWERVDDLGTPTALVCVAGGFAAASLAETDQRTLDAMLGTNLAGTLWCCQAAAARMRRSGGGSIVTVASRTAVTGTGPVAYAAAKAAVVRLTEVLAEELRPDRIRVNSVLPSVIDTPANRSWMSPTALATAVSPAAIARVVAFLCSVDATPISGAAIPVYGDA